MSSDSENSYSTSSSLSHASYTDRVPPSRRLSQTSVPHNVPRDQAPTTLPTTLHTHRNSISTPSEPLLTQKAAQITRLESILSSQNDEHMDELARVRTESVHNEQKLSKKSSKHAKKLEGKYKKKMDKLTRKTAEAQNLQTLAEQRAVGLAHKFSESQQALSLAKMRIDELTASLETSKSLNLTTLEQQASLNTYDGSTKQTLINERDQNSTLGLEIRNLRQQLLDEKETAITERARADKLNKEGDTRSSRLLLLQESLTVASEENSRLSRSLEGDRLTTADLRRTVKELRETSAAKELRLQDKTIGMKEKLKIIDELKVEVDSRKAEADSRKAEADSLKVNVTSLKSDLDASSSAAADLQTTLRTTTETLTAQLQSKERSLQEKEVTESKIRAEFIQVNSALCTERGNNTKLTASVTNLESQLASLTSDKSALLEQIDELSLQLQAENEKEQTLTKELQDERDQVQKEKEQALAKELEDERTRPAAPPVSEIETQTSPQKEERAAPPVLETLALDTSSVEYSEEEFDDENAAESVAAPPTAFDVYKTEQEELKKQVPQTTFNVRTVDVISDSDMINSTIVQLRSSLSNQDSELEQLKSELTSMKTEKLIALEQAGIAKLEALELAAKLEVQHTVDKIDRQVEDSFDHSAKKLVTTMDSIAGTAFEQLRLKEGFLENQLPATLTNSQLATSVASEATEIAQRLYQVYRGVHPGGTMHVEIPAGPVSPEQKVLDVSVKEGGMLAEGEGDGEQNRSVRFSTPAPQPPMPPGSGVMHMDDLMGGHADSPEVSVMMQRMGATAPFGSESSAEEVRNVINTQLPQQGGGGNSTGVNGNSNPAAFSQYSSMGVVGNNLPKLMQDLRRRVADEIYNVGETLFGVVDCDFRESLRGGRERNSKPVTDIERLEFKKALHKATHGTLRWLLLIYLRTYDSLQEMMNGKEVDMNVSRPGMFSVQGGEEGGRGKGAGGKKHGAPLAYEEDEVENPSDVLRVRMHGLLEDVKGTWERERRDLDKLGEGSLLREEYEEQGYYGEVSKSKGGGSKRPFHRTEMRRLNHACTKGCAICGFNKEMETGREKEKEDNRRNKLNFLDSGAGPREFWATVSPSISYHESKGEAVVMEEVEQHLWRLVLLVRCQDRSRGLRLQRHESQRKLLDLRFYELILMTVRMGFLGEKIVEVEPVRGGVGKGFLKLKFRDVGRWSGRGEAGGMGDVSMVGREGWREGAVFGAEKEAGGNQEVENFERITKEFDKMRRDRFGKSSYANEGGKMRSKLGSRGGLTMQGGGGAKGRGILNPEGHSRALGASLGGGGAARKKRGGGASGGGWAKGSAMGDGHLDMFSDRGAFF